LENQLNYCSQEAPADLCRPLIVTGVRGPLAHVRVLDLSRILAAPWSSQLLADLGAESGKGRPDERYR
jgi:CoA-transferase family III